MSRMRSCWPIALLLAAAAGSCAQDEPTDPPNAPAELLGPIERLSTGPIPRMDVLLAIDNSRAMGDKQRILAEAVAELIEGLANPRCLDQQLVPIDAALQPGPLGPCPDGSKRRIEPVTDIHIGVISSSIGGHGADSCGLELNSTECAPDPNITNNDEAHLLRRSDPCGGASVPTYLDHGFLAWDPAQKLMPFGETSLGDLMGTPGLLPNLHDLIMGAGEIGCEYESQLESIYRFLADPEPYASISVVNGVATPSPDMDLQLIAQRASFLRPDSLLAILMLSDENDCSIREYGQFYLAGQLQQGSMPFRLPRARAVCAVSPLDPCCYSCGQANIPASCPPDPTCTTGGQIAQLSEAEDHINLRCFDQKRRFGIDFLYPRERYVDALIRTTIPNRHGQLVPNPIFADLNPMDELRNIRDPGMVLLAGIIGVPWQDIARNPESLHFGFMSNEELFRADPAVGNVTRWEVILGFPPMGIPPLDPFMLESVVPRSGVNPVTGDPIVTAAMSPGNDINGHERTIQNDGLQYACTFPLSSPRDCTDPTWPSCACTDPSNDDPVCAPNPMDAMNPGAPTLQVRGTAYPSLRQLDVLRKMGPQGIVASVCPQQVDVPSSLNYGYRPAMQAVLERVSRQTAHCLWHPLSADADGRTSCLMLEGRRTQGSCTCDAAAGRRRVAPGHMLQETAARQDAFAVANGFDCFCEIQELAEDVLKACQNDPSGPAMTGGAVHGFCYIDATLPIPIGNPELVAQCPQVYKRTVRTVGAEAGSGYYIACPIQP